MAVPLPRIQISIDTKWDGVEDEPGKFVALDEGCRE